MNTFLFATPMESKRMGQMLIANKRTHVLTGALILGKSELSLYKLNSVFKCDHMLIIRPWLSLKPNKITCISATLATIICASQDRTKKFVNRPEPWMKFVVQPLEL